MDLVLRACSCAAMISASVLSFSPATDANPIIKESVAKQLLRTKRQDRPMKAGYPDEPMREHLLHMQALDLRAWETNLEHWLNPHCYPRCDRNYGHPV
ncbi:uncharacterized protein C17orf67 homolog isoform X1 [Pelmatolapia mariae]|uniref:uncharacterized protein C17orf67 homolog isoform X1 n=1 Tax=Pelmatolapia mariae TaxID=158779 RepID=UPI002FE62912